MLLPKDNPFFKTVRFQLDLTASVSDGIYQLKIITEKEIENKRLMITK